MARLQTAVTLVIAAGIIVGGCAGVYIGAGILQVQNRYHSAPVCASEADALAGEACRYTATATIGGGSSSVDFSVDGAPGRTFIARFDNPGWSWSFEQQVQAELWAGRVTLLDGQKTDDNPDSNPPGETLIVVSILIAVMGAAIAWVGYSGRRGVEDGSAGLGGMNPIGTSGVIYRP